MIEVKISMFLTSLRGRRHSNRNIGFYSFSTITTFQNLFNIKVYTWQVYKNAFIILKCGESVKTIKKCSSPRTFFHARADYHVTLVQKIGDILAVVPGVARRIKIRILKKIQILLSLFYPQGKLGVSQKISVNFGPAVRSAIANIYIYIYT